MFTARLNDIVHGKTEATHEELDKAVKIAFLELAQRWVAPGDTLTEITEVFNYVEIMPGCWEVWWYDTCLLGTVVEKHQVSQPKPSTSYWYRIDHLFDFNPTNSVKGLK